MCCSGEGEIVEHLLVTCWEFESGRWVLADEVSRIVEAEEWLEESKVALLLRKGVVGV